MEDIAEKVPYLVVNTSISRSFISNAVRQFEELNSIGSKEIVKKIEERLRSSVDALLNSEYIAGYFNTEIIRLAGRTNTDTFKSIKGATDYKLIHMFRDVWTPWDGNMTFP